MRPKLSIVRLSRPVLVVFDFVRVGEVDRKEGLDVGKHLEHLAEWQYVAAAETVAFESARSKCGAASSCTRSWTPGHPLLKSPDPSRPDYEPSSQLHSKSQTSGPSWLDVDSDAQQLESWDRSAQLGVLSLVVPH